MTRSDGLLPTLRLWAVIGEANSGKSSVVRHLSAAYHGRKEKSTLITTITPGVVLNCHVEVSALQEKKILPKKFIASIDKIQRARGKKGEPPLTDILIPLRLQKTTIKGATFPAWDIYISEFVNAGWVIQPLVFLQPLPNPNSITNQLASKKLSSVRAFYLSHQLNYEAPPFFPSNSIAYIVKGVWGWV